MSMTILRLCAVIIVLLSFTGCNSDPPVTPGDSVFGELPRITGIQLTTESGTLLGTWGEPGDYQGYPKYFYMYNAYPNPFDWSTTLTVRNVDTEVVTIWVVRGLGPGESERDIRQQSSTIVPIASPNQPIVVVRDYVIGPGQSSFELDFQSSDGPPVPGGFYRVYLSTASELFWVDVYRYDRDSDPIIPMVYDYWRY